MDYEKMNKLLQFTSDSEKSEKVRYGCDLDETIYQ